MAPPHAPRSSRSPLKVLFLSLLACCSWESSLGLQLPLTKLVRRYLVGTLLATTCALPLPAQAAYEADFVNGHVRIDEPLVLPLGNHKTVRLYHPVLVGQGGGGSVYSFDDSSQMLVKISWTHSAASVQRECDILQYLQAHDVTRTERCLGAQAYPDNPQLVMIALTPYVRDAVASVDELASPQLQRKAVQQISQTLVQMLAANVITIDVQPLISPTTGDVTLIDLTEAQILDRQQPAAAVLVASFCTEMLALIPDQWAAWAAQTVQAEGERLDAQGTRLSDTAHEILYSQTFLF